MKKLCDAQIFRKFKRLKVIEKTDQKISFPRCHRNDGAILQNNRTSLGSVEETDLINIDDVRFMDTVKSSI